MSQKLDDIIYRAQEFKEAFHKFGDVDLLDREPLASYLKAFLESVEAAPLLPGEKVFTIRYKDRVSPAAVRCWAHHAERQGAPWKTVNDAIRWADNAEQWQHETENMKHVKVPD